MKKESGQVILLLILIMTVALSIGLSIVQKSLVDISTASKVEQSSRAFSAAEAGVEKGLRGDTTAQTFTDNSSSIKQITGADLIPPAATAGNRQVALEYPPLAKEDVAQVWLADYTSSSSPPQTYYNQSSLDIWWGAIGITDSANKPAIEIKAVYYDSASGYQVRPFRLDSNSSRATLNGFIDASADCTSPSPITTTIGSNRQFFCKSTLSSLTLPLMLMRIRLLYSPTSQPLAIQSGVTCPAGPCTAYSLPSQAKEIISTGVSGETQRKVKIFLLNKVVPPYFDYAIFSAGEINKSGN